jgi:hypothetical protein
MQMKTQGLFLRYCGKILIDKLMQMEFVLDAVLWMYNFW